MASSHGEIRDYGDKEYKVIGTRPIRHDGTDKVTGRAVYGGDVQLPGMLYGQVLRSPHGHARIRSIDTSRAEALEGVRAVVTGLGDLPPTEGDEIVDLGEGPAKLKYMRDNVLATDKVLYRGHAVAGVAAINPHIAEEAPRPDRRRIRGAAVVHRGPRGDEGGGRAPARGPDHAGVRRGHRQEEQHRVAQPGQARGRRRRFRPGRGGCRV